MSWINFRFVRVFRLALIRGLVAFGDESIKRATIAPIIRSKLWEMRRSRLMSRVQILEAQLG